MLATIAAFELRKRARMLSTYVYFVVLFAFGFLMMIAAGGAFSSVSVGMGSEKVHANAPFAVNAYITLLSHFGLLVSAAVFGQAVHQDYETRSDALFFTTPVGKLGYLGGRFLGALLFVTVLFSAIALGAAAGTKMWFIDRALFGPNRLAAYAWPYVTTVVPNLILTGAVFFTLATLLRKMMPVYTGAVVLVIGTLVAGNLMAKLEHRTLGALLDPLGMRAGDLATKYWTVAEKNALLVPVDGVFLANRVLWLAVGVALLAWTVHRFRFAHGSTADKPQTAASAAPVEQGRLADPAAPLPHARFEPGRGVLATLVRLTGLAFRETVKNVYFAVIVLAGVLFMGVTGWQAGSMFGTTTYPVTYMMLEIAGGTFSIFILIIITFYAGELTWRERDAGTDQLMDALPLPTWMPFVAKLGALILVQVALLFALMATGIAIQTMKGYHHYELGLYVRDLFGLHLIDWCLLSILAMTVQAAVQHKYLGHFLMVLYYVSHLFMGRLGLEHNLYKFDEAPSYQYSDMNGYGHFLRPVFWFDFYWAAFAVLLALASSVLWARGTETRARLRLSQAWQRLSLPIRIASAAALATFVGVGGYIFYNTNVLNHYKTSHDREAATADYEKLYRSLLKVPQPRVTGVVVSFDIYPERQELRARGTYTLVNKTPQPVSTVYLNLPNDQRYETLAVGSTRKPTREDRRLGFYTFDLREPLAPGASVALDFDIDFKTRGFTNDSLPTAVVDNGTFFNSGALPQLGYQPDAELGDDNTRKKYGLAPKPRMADVNDAEARKDSYISRDADWVSFEATVSTAPDQIAIAPGYLQREWTEGGRRHFQYKMDAKILHFFSVLSARYQVERDKWNDVALEIYHHPSHTYDVDRMMAGMKAALEYCSTAFGPYQHRQARIIEFPRYASFAQSFPNTIPYSESIGFIAKVDPDDEHDIDYPYYVTAHEIAHQWWAHQVIGGNVQGATMLSETMAQYSALMVMKRAFGPGQMKRFLKYELDRYLMGRGFERKKEVPLERVENQGYIHYQKGSLVMYALQDYIGEDKLNAAISEYLKTVKFQEPPYTNSIELVDRIRKVTPPDLQYLIEDLFETITLYDNRAISATSKKLGDGRFEVKVKVSSKKLRAGELGDEKEIAENDLMDVGAIDYAGKPIVLEKRRIKSGETELSLVVDQAPAKAGIDPLNKLIDRKSDDNLIKVEHL